MNFHVNLLITGPRVNWNYIYCPFKVKKFQGGPDIIISSWGENWRNVEEKIILEILINFHGCLIYSWISADIRQRLGLQIQILTLWDLNFHFVRIMDGKENLF